MHGMNRVDQHDLNMLHKFTDIAYVEKSVEKGLERAQSNCQTWLELSRCVEFLDQDDKTSTGQQQNHQQQQQQGSFAGMNCDVAHTHVLSSVSDAVLWCDQSHLDHSNGPVPVERIQVLVTGSFLLIGIVLRILGCELD